LATDVRSAINNNNNANTDTRLNNMIMWYNYIYTC